jgi:YggT family protein
VWLDFIDILCQILGFAIVIRAILSWFTLRPDNPLMVIFSYLTEPILAPLRRIIPRIGMFDITPVVAIILLLIIDNIAHYLLS